MRAHLHPRRVTPPVLTGFFLFLVFASGSAMAQQCGSVDTYAWMLGKWRSNVETTVFTEQWEKAPDGSMKGYAESRSSETGEVFQTESLTLRASDGAVQYVADVSVNHDEVAFDLVSCDAENVVFENPDHDFPKRIHYQRAPEGMSARITDLEDKGFELNFTRDQNGT